MPTTVYPARRKPSFIKRYLELVYRVACSKTLVISGVRKIVEDVSWELTLEELYSCEVTMEDLGYTKAKTNQLLRNYWDEEAVATACEKIKSRLDMPHTSVAFQLKNGAKDSRSQGYCMQNLVITNTPNGSTIDIYYRSTEVLQKFLADIVFFKRQFPHMLKLAGIKPSKIRFKFANVYLSAMFMPILFRYDDNPKDFFEVLALDERFNRTCCGATAKFFQESHNYTYRSRVKMFEYAKKYISPKKFQLLSEILKDYRNVKIEDEDDAED